MSDRSFLSALRFFRPKGDRFGCREEKTADDWVQTRCGQRDWESFYRQRWQYDKKVRSTHGVNCTGKPRTRTTRPAARDTPITSRAAARAGPPAPGTLTARCASSTP